MRRTESRLEDLRRMMVGDGLDALVVSSETNVRYLTGFRGEQTALLVTPERALMISDAKYTAQLAADCPELEAHIRPIGQSVFGGIGEVVSGFGAHRVGFEPASTTVAQFEVLKARGGPAEWIPYGGRVEALRAIKDAGEIEEIRRAIDQAERAFLLLREGLRVEDSEKDAADSLEAHLRRCGASYASFAPIVAVGAHAALPHAKPRPEARIGDADFTLVDWGASHGPYKSDLTRMVVTGKVTPKFERVYRTVLAAQERAIAALRPGVTAGEVDRVARSTIEEAGFGPFFTHGLGHGVGMEIHEDPFFRRDNPLLLRAGMVVTIEPGVYLPDWGGVRIEDDVLITPDGTEILTHAARTLESTILSL
ncbi:M24 family metallopeptidase [Tundrisphaera sp. TA3]|uniref:M24 family metallopeptidase n=1 Tax=Tundrisphaera sp. TA3 TaxID=3435775 RepID=UPI003EBBE21E